MLFLLRKIRRKLMQKNKFTTYLLYAIGEIVLVVIGILIAVSINNWNTERKIKQEEQALLKKLLTEQLTDISRLDATIENHLAMNAALKRLHQLIFNLEAINIDTMDQQTFEVHVGMLYYSPSYNAKLGFMNSAINSGQLSIIQNDSIAMLIGDWEGLYENYKSLVQNVYDLVQFQIIPYLADKHSFANATKNMNLLKGSKGSKFDTDRKAILDDRRLETYTELKRIDAERSLELAQEMRDSKVRLIKLLRMEIDNQ